MTIKLNIPVPNVAALLSNYDVIRVFRSSTSRDGPFAEVTSAVPTAATLSGTVSGPFTSLNGKTLILRVSTQHGVRPDISVTFVAANPATISSVVTAINNAATGVLVAADDGNGKAEISTVATGSAVKLQVVGGTALADLGFALYQADSGEDPFIPLVSNTTTYQFFDLNGQDTDWYRWQFYSTSTMAGSALVDGIQPQSARIDPSRKVADHRSTRGLTLIRGREHTFRMAFWEDLDAGIPLVPFDAGRYPSYSIYDPNGTAVQTGRAEIDGSTPNYKAMFTPPAGAMLSNDDRRWRIDWFLLSETGRPVQASEVFDIRDPDTTQVEPEEQKILMLDGDGKRLKIVLPHRPVSLSLQVGEANSARNMLELPAVYPPQAPNPSLVETPYGEHYVYSYDVPAGLLVSGANGLAYNVVWRVLESPTAEEDIEFEIVEVMPKQCLQFMKSLRMAIDRFNKPRDAPQGYKESDLYEYLQRGLQWVNGYEPVHLAWSMTGVPPAVQPYWLLAATWWGLNAQMGVEIDLQFGFSGQSVTLDYDHASALDSWASKVNDTLNTRLPALKKQLYRKSSSVGAYSGRSMRRSGLNNYVFQLSHDHSNTSMGGNGFLSILTQIGLI